MQLNVKPSEKINRLQLTDKQPYNHVVVTLMSGTRYLVSEIKLFNRQTLAKANALKAQGAQKMGGWSSGIGFWGSLDWAFTGALLLGAIEKSVTKDLVREGAELLAQAQLEFDRARREGRYFPVCHIEKLNFGLPQLWLACAEKDVRFIHNGEDVVAIKTQEGAELMIIWNKVEQLWVQ